MSTALDTFKSFIETSFTELTKEQKEYDTYKTPEQGAKDEYQSFVDEMEAFSPSNKQSTTLNNSKYEPFVKDWSANYQTTKNPVKEKNALDTLDTFDFKSIPLEATNAIKIASSIFEGDEGESFKSISEFITNAGAIESRYKTKKQLNNGPARSFWQVEPVTAKDILTNASKLFGDKFEKTFAKYNKDGKGALNYLQKLSTKELSTLLETDATFAASIAGAKYIQTRSKKNSNLRDPYESELNYFKENPNVAGMATEDNKVILNPYSKLSDKEKESVITNETARIKMRDKKYEPTFELTAEQRKFLDSTTYKNASDKDRKATIAARILSGDPSAGKPTKEQLEFVQKLK